MPDNNFDELKSALNAFPKGKWHYSVSKSGRYQISIRGANQVCMMWSTHEHPANITGPALCAIYNQIPDLLTALDKARAELDALKRQNTVDEITVVFGAGITATGPRCRFTDLPTLQELLDKNYQDVLICYENKKY